MADLSFGFAPPDYGDWTNYAGFNRKTGEIESSSQSGIAPPQNFSEYVSQRMQPAQQMIGGLSTSAEQLGQGNFTQAMGTMRNARKPVLLGQQPAVATQPQVTAPLPGYDYSHNIEQPGS